MQNHEEAKKKSWLKETVTTSRGYHKHALPPMVDSMKKATPINTAFNLLADLYPPPIDDDLGGPIILYPKGAPRPGSARYGKATVNDLDKADRSDLDGLDPATNFGPKPLETEEEEKDYFGLPKIKHGMVPSRPGENFSWRRNLHWSKQTFDVSQRALVRCGRLAPEAVGSSKDNESGHSEEPSGTRTVVDGDALLRNL